MKFLKTAISIATTILLASCIDSLDKSPLAVKDVIDSTKTDNTDSIITKIDTVITTDTIYSSTPITAVNSTSGELKILGGKVFKDSIRVSVRYSSGYDVVYLKLIDSSNTSSYIRDTIHTTVPADVDSSYLITKGFISGKSYKLILRGKKSGNFSNTDTTIITIPTKDSILQIIKDTTFVIDTIGKDTSKTDTTTALDTVDAVSSATSKHKILGGVPTANSVSVHFYFYYNNGMVTMQLRNKATQAVVSSIPLTGVYTSKSSQSVTIQNLTPATSYELFLEATYRSTRVNTPLSTFTTLAQ